MVYINFDSMLPNYASFSNMSFSYDPYTCSFFNFGPSQFSNIIPFWNFNTVPMNNVLPFDAQQPVKIQNLQENDYAIPISNSNQKRKTSQPPQKIFKVTLENSEKEIKNKNKFEHLRYYDPLQAPLLTSFKELEQSQKVNSDIQQNIDQYVNVKKINCGNRQYFQQIAQQMDPQSPFIIVKNYYKKKPRRLLLAQLRKFRRSLKQKQQIQAKKNNKKNALRPLTLKSNLKSMKNKIKKDYQYQTRQRTFQNIITRSQLQKKIDSKRLNLSRIDKKNVFQRNLYAEKNKIKYKEKNVNSNDNYVKEAFSNSKKQVLKWKQQNSCQ